MQCSLLTRNKWGARPTGRRLCCKQKIRVRFPGDPLSSIIRLGRQPEDHFGLEPEMLWVRIPLELLQTSCGCSVQRPARLASNQLVSVRIRVPVLFANNKSSWSSGVLACLSRKRSSVQIRSGTLFKSNGVVRKPVKRRSSNLRDCLWVRLPPALLFQRTNSQVAEQVDARPSDSRAHAACEFNSRLGYFSRTTLQVRQVSN